MGTEKLTHGAEFELLHDQITLYQRELAYTWLWAIIADLRPSAWPVRPTSCGIEGR